MEKILNSKEKLVVAIIHCEPVDPVSGKEFLKYSFVDCTPRGINTFLIFAAKFPTADYINFYGKKSRNYLDRIYIH